MANCVNCGAPLPMGSHVCQYCNTRNDIDFKGIHQHTVEEVESDRICPRCNIPLQTIDLKIEGKFLIEKCGQCYGLFFDPGELEALLDKSVSNVFDINYKQLEQIRNTPRHDDYPVRYIKCPQCRKLMNRINFGSSSGVVVDKCRECGVWLDGGELKQLMEWVKAGGKLMHHQKYMEQEKMEIERQKRKLRQQAMKSSPGGHFDPYPVYQSRGMGSGIFGAGGAPDLLGILTKVVSKII